MEPSSIRTNEPYRHPAIIAILHNYFFSNRTALGYRFSGMFESSVEDDDAKEIPQAMLGLVAVAIRSLLPIVAPETSYHFFERKVDLDGTTTLR